MEIEFWKYQSIGNDFILIDNRNNDLTFDFSSLSIHLCDRHLGVGGDGLIILYPGSNECDFTMKIYNSDGSEAKMCGNGVRCLALFCSTFTKNCNISFSTLSGRIDTKIVSPQQIHVNLGIPKLLASEIPTTIPADSCGFILDSPITIGSQTFNISAINMGNPHAVLFVDEDWDVEGCLREMGQTIETLPEFPDKTNVEFVQVKGVEGGGHGTGTGLKVWVWERGAGRTLACGTGAGAALVAAVMTGRVCEERAKEGVRVILEGGETVVRMLPSESSSPPSSLYCEVVAGASRVFRGECLLSHELERK